MTLYLQKERKNMKRIDYPYEQYVQAYLDWVNAIHPRHEQWFTYCDMRDGLPLGMSKKIFSRQQEREEKRMYQ